jgi:hypothetical protein
MAKPLSAEQLAALTRAGVAVWHRGHQVSLGVTFEALEPSGAVIRAENAVLDVVPGEIEHGDFEITEPPERPSRRRRRPPNKHRDHMNPRHHGIGTG